MQQPLLRRYICHALGLAGVGLSTRQPSYAMPAVVKRTRTCQTPIWTRDNLITPDSDQRLVGGIMQGRQITAEAAARLPYDKMADMSFVKTARGAT